MSVNWLSLPSITLTNERNEDARPSTALDPQSPTASSQETTWHRKTNSNENIVDPATGMQSTCRASVDTGITASLMSDTRSSPSRLRKTRSNNGSSISTTLPVAASTATTSSTNARDVRSEHDTHAQHAIDPLSSHIIKRTSMSPLTMQQQPQTQPHLHSRHIQDQQATSISRRSSSETTPSMRTDDARSRSRSRSRSGQRPDVADKARDDLKKGVKAVAFISRLMGHANKKKDTSEVLLDTASIASETQIEGNEAEVFTQPMSDSVAFSLTSTQAPTYIKMRSRNKERREFDRLFLAQELQSTKRRKLQRTDSSRLLMRRKSTGPGEVDTVWAMQFSRDGMHLAAAGAGNVVRVWKVLSSLDDRKAHESQETSKDEHLSAPVFQSQPVREYEGHEAAILDLSWSKNNFLISSSMDKTVRLWHLSRAECLCTFKHNDIVPSIAFHPKDDRFFLAGSLDSKLRLWDVSEKKVAYSVTAPDMITAVGFMPDGKLAVAGTVNGACYWYETEGLKYKTTLHIRPDKGQGISGPKITAIQAAQGRGGDKVLVTSNDSKVRLYNVRDKGCEMVFRGNVNDSSQIRASLSDDGRYVVCGSEDRKAYIWSVTPTETGKLDKKPLEYFDAHDTATLCVCIAPAKTRRLLAQSEDPIYDSAVSGSTYALARTESHGSTRTPTELPNSFNESETQSLLNRSASVLAKAGYKNGNIIVTADYAGKIKVFRQDCAWHRRQDDADRSSMFRRGERSSLASSLQTKSSQKSLREAKNAAMAQVASSDRIMTWRQGIASTPAIPVTQASPQIQAQSGESSPINLPSRASQEDTTSPGSPSTNPTSTTSAEKPVLAPSDSVEVAQDVFKEQASKSDGSHFRDGNRSYAYYDKEYAIQRNEHARQMFRDSLGRASDLTLPGAEDQLHNGPGLQHRISYVSQLSDEDRPDEQGSGDEHFDDATERQIEI